MTICVECYADITLVQKLIGQNNIKHSGNKSSVLYDLAHHHTSSIGMVDEDPGKSVSGLIHNYREIRNHFAEDILVLYDRRRDNYLISINEDLEDWILKISRTCGINISNYSLPNDRERLHRVIRGNLDKFQKLLDDLLPLSGRLILLQKELLNP